MLLCTGGENVPVTRSLRVGVAFEPSTEI
ncbi:rCG55393 [Rattus norvegicus]|uniref:RCG55393 n=1 Tax=Rattus norvegicus TaxID=10116 RepID=A6JRA0_RAT|nr:rCG55393 [Rattus norvegicus]